MYIFLAGDYVKFGLPFAGAMTMLAWGMADFKQGYVKAGQWDYAKDSLKWGMDFMIKVIICNTVLIIVQSSLNL